MIRKSILRYKIVKLVKGLCTLYRPLFFFHTFRRSDNFLCEIGVRNLSNHSEHTRSNKVAWNALLNCGQVCGALESKWFKNPAGQYLMSSARLQWTWGTVPSRLRTKKRREEHARVPTPTHYKFSIVLKSHFRFFSNSYILLGLVDCRFSNNCSKKNSKKLPKKYLKRQ